MFFDLPSRVALCSAVSHFFKTLQIFEPSTSKSGICRSNKELDDSISSIFLAESTSLIHTIASVGKLELNQT